MTKLDCSREGAIRAALAGGDWSPGLLEHVAECGVCSDLMLVEKFLRQHGGEVSSHVSVPDPSFVWWRAQHETRAAAAHRAIRIITVVQGLAVGCGGLVAALGVTRHWSQIRDALAGFVPASLPSPLPSDMAQPGLVMLASLAAVAVLLVFDLREPRTGD